MPANTLQKINRMMMRLLLRVMPSCKDVSLLISENMDGNLSFRQRLSIRIHVSMCRLCRRYQKQLHLLRDGTCSYADPDTNTAAQSLSPEARARLEKVLDHARD